MHNDRKAEGRRSLTRSEIPPDIASFARATTTSHHGTTMMNGHTPSIRGIQYVAALYQSPASLEY